MNIDFTYNYEKSMDARDLFKKYKKTNEIWRDYYQDGAHIGNLMDLMAILNPNTPEEFEKKYYEYNEANPSLKIGERGRTHEEMLQLTETYKNHCIRDIKDLPIFTDQQWYDCVIAHTISETFNGNFYEIQAMNLLNSKGIKCTQVKNYIDENGNKTNIKFDSKYGVDLLAEINNENKFYIQVKPISFFNGFRNRFDTRLDNYTLIEKYFKVKNELNREVYYAIYNSREREWVANKNDGICFRLNQIYDITEEGLNHARTIASTEYRENNKEKADAYRNNVFLKELSKKRLKIFA